MAGEQCNVYTGNNLIEIKIIDWMTASISFFLFDPLMWANIMILQNFNSHCYMGITRSMFIIFLLSFPSTRFVNTLQIEMVVISIIHIIMYIYAYEYNREVDYVILTTWMMHCVHTFRVIAIASLTDRLCKYEPFV